MDEKYLNELKEVENRLYDIIANQNDENILNSKLGEAWINLYNYLLDNGVQVF